MATPSREAFAEFKEVCNSPFMEVEYEAFKEIFTEDDLYSATLSEATAFVETVFKEKENRTLKLQNSEVYLWVMLQAGYRRTLEILFPKKTDGLKANIASAIANRSKWMIEDPSRIRSRAKIIAKTRNPGMHWGAQTILALDQYLHIDHEEAFRAQEKFNENCKKIILLTNEIRPFVTIREGDSANDFQRLGYVASLHRRYGTNKLRNQKNKAEHRFIELMFGINKSIFRTAKPNAIAELMTLECFERQMDLRTIGRTCTALATAKSR